MNFNSIIVRLKLDTDHQNYTDILHFNSIIVRLKRNNQILDITSNVHISIL